MNFEICAVNIQSALAAQGAGAQRIELCSALDAGGLTPSFGLIHAAKRALSIPVQVLIRPREGGFCYNDLELEMMIADIRYCQEAGVAGVVVGALTDTHELDIAKMKAMKTASGAMEITCHRAFDFTKHWQNALEQLIELGYTRVLSSGQADSAYKGRFILQQMVAQANGRIAVMPGAGINAENIQAISSLTGAKDFHFTAKKKISSPADQAIPGLESWYWESDESEIRKIMAAISNRS